jgi:hypothetical protein
VDGPAEPIGQPLRLQGRQLVRVLGHPVEQHLTERRRDPALLLDLIAERRAGALGDQHDGRLRAEVPGEGDGDPAAVEVGGREHEHLAQRVAAGQVPGRLDVELDDLVEPDVQRVQVEQLQLGADERGQGPAPAARIRTEQYDARLDIGAVRLVQQLDLPAVVQLQHDRVDQLAGPEQGQGRAGAVLVGAEQRRPALLPPQRLQVVQRGRGTQGGRAERHALHADPVAALLQGPGEAGLLDLDVQVERRRRPQVEHRGGDRGVLRVVAGDDDQVGGARHGDLPQRGRGRHPPPYGPDPRCRHRRQRGRVRVDDDDRVPPPPRPRRGGDQGGGPLVGTEDHHPRPHEVVGQDPAQLLPEQPRDPPQREDRRRERGHPQLPRRRRPRRQVELEREQPDRPVDDVDGVQRLRRRRAPLQVGEPPQPEPDRHHHGERPYRHPPAPPVPVALPPPHTAAQ